MPKIYLNDVQPVSAFRPVLSRHLDALLLKGLANVPAQRFANAQELRQQLEAAEAQLVTAPVGSA